MIGRRRREVSPERLDEILAPITPEPFEPASYDTLAEILANDVDPS